MAISHAKSNTIGDFTGTVTILNSQGSTATANATDLIRPGDWNSVHNQVITLSGNTAGTSTFSGTNIVFEGGNNITLSGNTAAGAATIVVSAGAGGGSQTFGMSNLGNTSGTTGVVSATAVRMLFAGGNNITLSQSLNGASGTITISAANAPAVLSQTGGISNLGNTAGTSGVASGAQMRLLFAGGNNITLSQSTNGASATITISGPNTVAQTAQTLGLYGSSQTVGQSSSSTVDARSLSIVGQGIVSVGMSGGSLLVSATAAAGGIAASIGGNSTSGAGGYSNITSGTMVLMGGPNITLSQDGRSISVSANAPGGATGALTVGVSDQGNTAGTTGMVSSRLVLVGGSNITLSGSVNGQSATVSIVGGAPVKTMLSYQPRQLGASTTTQWTNGQIWVQPFRIDNGFAVSASTLQYLQSIGGTYTSAVAASHAETMSWCIYLQNAASNTRFDSMSSGSFTWWMSNSGTSSAGWGYGTTSSSSAATGILTQVSGVRMINIPLNFSITEGLYLMALNLSTTSGGYSALASRYAIYMDGPALVAMGSGFGSAAATNIGYVDAGSYSTTSAAMPSSIGISQILQHSNLVPFFKLGAI